MLVGMSQHLLTCGKNVYLGRAFAQCCDDERDVIEKVFAIVENEQQALASERPHAQGECGVRVTHEAERTRHGRRNQRWVSERRQFHDLHVVAEIIAQIVRNRLRETRLADASGSDQGDQRLVQDQITQGADVIGATVKCGWLDGCRRAALDFA